MSMSEFGASPILDDLPAKQDSLDFAPYRQTLAEILSDPATRTPLTIGVFGTWGSGKTTLMSMIRDDLADQYRVVWFDAWRYDKEDALWRALLLRVLDNLKPGEDDHSDRAKDLREEIGWLEEGLYRDVEWEEKGGLSIDWPELVKGTAGGALKLSFAFVPGLATLKEAVEAAKKTLGEGKVAEDASALVKAFRRDVVAHYQAQLRSIEQFQDRFSKLVAKHVVGRGQRLAVFVDDLDRCLPEKAIEVLEAIKLFLDAPGCVFVPGLDQDVVARGIKVKYRDFAVEADEQGVRRIPIDGVQYLEKIIQLPFILPSIEAEDMHGFVDSLAPYLPDPRCSDVFALGLPPNPRQVKRTINIFLLLWRLADKRERLKGQVKPVRLAKVVAIRSKV